MRRLSSSPTWPCEKRSTKHGTFDRKTRAALLLTVAATDECAYTVALNTMIARHAGWSESETVALRRGRVEDPQSAALVNVTRQCAANRGHVDDATWHAALDAGWTDAKLAEAWALIGLAQFVDSFVNYAQTDIDPQFHD